MLESASIAKQDYLRDSMGNLHNTMTRGQKAAILLSLDGFFMSVALFTALQLRLGQVWPVQYFPQGTGLFILMPLIGMALSWWMGIPRIVLRTFERRAILRLGQFASIMALICAALNTGFSFGLPRSIPGIWAAVFLFFAVFSRLFLLDIMDRIQSRASPKKSVLIYGAGSTGQQLMAALQGSPDVKPVGFLDENPALRKVEVSGLRVFLPDDLPTLIERRGVAQVILAMPSITPGERRRILKQLEHLAVEVLTLPSFETMLDGRALQDQLRPVSVDDLLGRDTVDLSSEEVSAAYTGKTIMISGAGGSIGSELCRQLLETNPARIVLYEQSEFALYQIDMDLRELAHNEIEIVSILGSVCDAPRVERTLLANGVQIILHAAAYKHVPLVEENEVEGARNNIIGTRTLADAAEAAGVERFILVSTDKAVRPTNVMGATKRMAELVVQDRQTRSKGTIFTMVRFGNVLGSSGSVIPLFRKQIQSGGPVTLTHADVTRYFMTIPEAAQLVLLAGSFAEGGEVFVLDMGKPVKIWDLARSLIELSGFTVKDEANPKGDISIEITGLRPGEKLYEELLIDDTTIATPHPKILRAAEGLLSETETASSLRDIESAVSAGDGSILRTILEHRLDGYSPETGKIGGQRLSS